MSKLLAIDTSGDACSVALQCDGHCDELFEIAPRSHAQRLLPMIETLLDRHSLRLKELDAMAFSCGPGSFTGLRIAAGVTQGLAFGAGLPVIAVSSLQALAMQYQGPQPESVLVVLDARMDEIYCGLYALQSGLAYACTEDWLCTPQDLGQHLQVRALSSLSLLGGGAELVRQQLADSGKLIRQVDEQAQVHALDVCTLACEKFLHGEFLTAEEAIPVYLRSATAWKKIAEQ